MLWIFYISNFTCESFSFFSRNFMPFIYFYGYIIETKTASTKLKEVTIVDILFWFSLKIRESVQYFNCMYIVGCRFLDLPLIRLMKFPSSSSLLRVFYGILSNTFSESIEMIMYLFSILLMWWIALIDFRTLNQSFIPEIKLNLFCFYFVLNFSILVWQKLAYKFTFS